MRWVYCWCTIGLPCITLADALDTRQPGHTPAFHSNTRLDTLLHFTQTLDSWTSFPDATAPTVLPLLLS